jgi:hypothetical protein
MHLIPAKYVTPFDSIQIRQVRAGIENEELENCLQEAYAVHYFTNAWIPELKEQGSERYKRNIYDSSTTILSPAVWEINSGA